MKNKINLHKLSNIVIWILTLILLVLIIYTIVLSLKVKKIKSLPHNSINVSPPIEKSFKPTFNKKINYLGSDLSMF
ncbi:MAG: hypothetical protein ACRDD2_01360 [Sarcina sp.]